MATRLRPGTPYFTNQADIYQSQPGGGLLWRYWNSTDPAEQDLYNQAWDRFTKAAEISGASTAAGAGLVQRTVTSGTNQQFEFVAADDGHVRLKARHSGLFLQPTGTANGADVVQQADSTATGQQWRVVDHGSGVVSLVNRQSGLAMDVWNYSTVDGARIALYTYNASSPNQRFTRRSV
jgi:hypothetical protein